MSRSRAGRLLTQAWSVAARQSTSATSSFGAICAFSHAAQESAPRTTESLRGMWGKMSLGFAAAFATAATASCAATATTAAPTKGETVKVNDVTISVSGDAHIKHKVIFVLGGPGSGKGTQCAKLVEDYDIAHFSAGDLLREHIKSGTPDGNMVADMIKNGQIVPAEVTVKLLQKAMAESGKLKVLIDGFPRNDDNRKTFERVIGYDCELVLFFDCPESVLEERLLKRGESSGRSDDNMESIKKRFKVFLEQSLPVVEHYETLGKVRKLDTNRSVDVIYKEVCSYVEAI